MKREIKFRIWTPEVTVDGNRYESTMQYPTFFGSSDDTFGWTTRQYIALGSVSQSPYDGDFRVLMQFTGLCDKNGKEIYEGDIIQNTRKWGFSNDSGGKWVVEFNIETGCYGLLPDGEYVRKPYEDIAVLTRKKSNECVVLGNIYETPDLING